jgi:hypothetical protein
VDEELFRPVLDKPVTPGTFPRATTKYGELNKQHADLLAQWINSAVDRGLAGVKCPRCHRRAEKTDNCTHLPCENVGGEKGCGTVFCYCCGGELFTDPQRYAEAIQTKPETVAMMSKYVNGRFMGYSTLREFAQIFPMITPPGDDSLLTGEEKGTIPLNLHNGENFEFSSLFQPENPLPCGRCPQFLHELCEVYKFFSDLKEVPDSGEVREKLATERWIELRVLFHLSRAIQAVGNNELCSDFILHSPRFKHHSLDFIVRWVKGGMKTVCAMQNYSHLVPLPDPSSASPSRRGEGRVRMRRGAVVPLDQKFGRLSEMQARDYLDIIQGKIRDHYHWHRWHLTKGKYVPSVVRNAYLFSLETLYSSGPDREEDENEHSDIVFMAIISALLSRH